jgi:K+-sensing histidine kinase KdpD
LLERHLAIRTFLVGAAGLAVLALALIPVRESIGVANVGLAMAIVVGIVGSRAGLAAGVATAAWAAVLFALLHSVPLGLPRLEDEQDGVTAMLLVITGVLTGALHRRSQQAERRTRDAGYDLARLHRVADLAAHGGAASDVLVAAVDEIVAELQLKRCWRTESTEREHAELQRNGLIAGLPVDADPELVGKALAAGVAIDLGPAGQLLLVGRPGVNPTQRQLRVAVMLADFAASALNQQPIQR